MGVADAPTGLRASLGGLVPGAERGIPCPTGAQGACHRFFFLRRRAFTGSVCAAAAAAMGWLAGPPPPPGPYPPPPGCLPFLCRVQVLVLAGTDRLDKLLTIGQMQGKFQLVLLPQVGWVVVLLLRLPLPGCARLGARVLLATTPPNAPRCCRQGTGHHTSWRSPQCCRRGTPSRRTSQRERRKPSPPSCTASGWGITGCTLNGMIWAFSSTAF